MSPPTRKYISPLIHAVIWLCLFLYPFSFHYLSISDPNALIRVFLFVVLLTILFYGNSLVLVPKVLGRKKVITYLVIIAISILLIAVTGGYLQMIFNPEYSKKPELFRISFVTMIIAGLFTWIISSALKVTSEWLKNQQKLRMAETEKLQAELNFLKAQVNPHFLFNALNNIYAMDAQKSDHTGEAILKLSELVRHMLYETSAEFITLEKEMEYIRNYVELQKLSLSENIHVAFNVSGPFADKKIEPMLLIPLVENVFKHGVSYQNPGGIKIDVSLTGDQLNMSTENPITRRSIERTDKGIGLVNLTKRLSLLYPDQHQFSFGNKDGIFETRLTITLK